MHEIVGLELVAESVSRQIADLNHIIIIIIIIRPPARRTTTNDLDQRNARKSELCPARAIFTP